MRAAEQWREIENGLPEDWEEARVSFTVEDARAAAGAAEVLAPLNPGRSGSELRFHVARSGSLRVDSVRNLLARLDRRRIWGALQLLAVRVAETAAPASERMRLAGAWDQALRALPPDWSDLLCELEVDSSDYLPRAALLGAPLNPSRVPDKLALRFRVSHTGYGASASMARRCLERMDEERITGRLTVLDSLSEVDNVATQGSLFSMSGRSL